MKHAVLGLLTLLLVVTPSWANDDKKDTNGPVEVLSVEKLPVTQPAMVLQDIALDAVEEPVGCFRKRQDERLRLASYVHLVGIGMELPYDWTLVNTGSVLATDYVVCKIKQRKQKRKMLDK